MNLSLQITVKKFALPHHRSDIFDDKLIKTDKLHVFFSWFLVWIDLMHNFDDTDRTPFQNFKTALNVTSSFLFLAIGFHRLKVDGLTSNFIGRL